jgi:hypothetical protein
VETSTKYIVTLREIQKSFRSLPTYAFSLLLWVGFSLLYLSSTPREWWIYRDDSVIHLSQAKNLALFGSIGISAGERVESMSSPLNFYISLLAYLINPDISYQTYLSFYLPITLLILSVAINFALLAGIKPSKNKTKFVFTLNTILFLTFVSSWTTFGWTISGMENILIVILLASLIGALLQVKKNLGLLLASISLLGIARIELSVLIFPILAFVAFRYEGLKIRRWILFLMPLTFWIIVHSIRFWYFGNIFPNTATALGKNLSNLSVFFLFAEFAFILFVLFVYSNSQRNQSRISKITLAIILILGVSKLANSNLTALYMIASLVSLLCILLVLLFLAFKTHLNYSTILLALVSLIPFNHFMLFGPARLSAFRIVSAFFIPIVLLLLIKFGNRLAHYSNPKQSIVFLLPVVFFILIFIGKFDPPRNLCCFISPSDSIINLQAQNIFPSTSSNSPLPIVANPDLGKISFSKNLNNVDLGLIGEPILARLMKDSNLKVNEYLLDYAAPDVLELHGYWNCVYSSLLLDQRFKSNWKIAWSGTVSIEMNDKPMPECPRNGRYTIWKRTIPVEEMEITLAIANDPFQVYSRKVIAATQSCGQSASGCQYLTRAIIRNRALLIQENTLLKTVELLIGSPSYKFDYLKVMQPRNWEEDAYLHYINLTGSNRRYE